MGTSQWPRPALTACRRLMTRLPRQPEAGRWGAACPPRHVPHDAHGRIVGQPRVQQGLEHSGWLVRAGLGARRPAAWRRWPLPCHRRVGRGCPAAHGRALISAQPRFELGLCSAGRGGGKRRHGWWSTEHSLGAQHGASCSSEQATTFWLRGLGIRRRKRFLTDTSTSATRGGIGGEFGVDGNQCRDPAHDQADTEVLCSITYLVYTLLFSTRAPDLALRRQDMKASATRKPWTGARLSHKQRYSRARRARTRGRLVTRGVRCSSPPPGRVYTFAYIYNTGAARFVYRLRDCLPASPLLRSG